MTWVCLSPFSYAADPVPGPVSKRFPWDFRPMKCFAPEASTNTPMCAELPNWPDYAATVSRVQSLFTEPDFELIARAERELAQSTERFPNGEYHFDAWYWALDVMFEQQPDRYAGTRQKWKAAGSEKNQVVLAESLLLSGEAWAARGGGFANTVSPEAWKIFAAKMAEAEDVLDAASAALKRSGAWHTMKVSLAMQRDAPRGAEGKEFRSAVAAWPEYGRIYKTAINLSLPQWGGTFADVEAVAQYAYERTKAAEGATWYATLYADTFAGNRRYNLSETKVDWRLAKKGFHDAIGKPGTDGRLFSFAGMACQMRDREEARRLYGLIDQLPEAKRPRMSPDPCRVFAEGSDPKGI